MSIYLYIESKNTYWDGWQSLLENIHHNEALENHMEKTTGLVNVSQASLSFIFTFFFFSCFQHH